MPLNNINEDVVFVVGHAPNTSSTTSSGLTFGVHDHSPNLDLNLERVKNLDWVAGQPIQTFHKNTNSTVSLMTPPPKLPTLRGGGRLG